MHTEIQPAQKLKPPEPPLRRAGTALTVASGVLIGFATLAPGVWIGGSPSHGGDRIHLTPQLADLILNLALFAPLGAGLALRGVRAGRVAAVTFVLSLSIEIGQLWIPGRNPALFDLLADTAGALLGAAFVRSERIWRRADPDTAGRLALATAVWTAAAWLATGWLLAPAPSATEPYWGMWTPHVSHLHHYEGRVLYASVDDLPIGHGRLIDSAGVRERLAADYALRVEAVAAPPPPRMSALLLISDQREREILLLSPDGNDLVYRFRSRGKGLGLGGARIRIPDALAGLRPGQPLIIQVARAGADICIEINRRAHCQLGFTLGSGWLTLASPLDVYRLPRWALRAAWTGLFLLPLGYWHRRSRWSAAALALVAAGAVAAPLAVPLLPAGAPELGGALAGFAAGLLLRGRAGARPPAERSQA